MSIENIQQTDAMRMTGEEIEQHLLEEGVGIIALPDRDAPYAIPMSFGYDGDDALYFTYLLFGAESKKEELSDRAETARFLVYSTESMYEWWSVLLTGTIEAVPEEEWGELRAAMENAWYPSLFSAADPMRGIEGYRFTITDQTGIRHSIGDDRR